MSKAPEFITSKFGDEVRVLSDIWYGERLVEVLAVSANGPRGGAPKRVQVLLTLDQARDLLSALSAALKDDE